MDRMDDQSMGRSRFSSARARAHAQRKNSAQLSAQLNIFEVAALTLALALMEKVSAQLSAQLKIRSKI